MSQIIAIASGKGGVGKTLVTASLSVALVKSGYSVLAADADMGLRDLDLLFGVQDEVLYDAVDVMKQRCSADEAIIPVVPGLDFLAASQKHTWEKVDAPTFQYTLETLAPSYDYILIDCPPGRGRAYKDAVAIADEILFIVEPSWSSIRDASRVMQFCNKHKQFHYAALLNNFYADTDGFVPVAEAISALPAERLAGILPHDRQANALAQKGEISQLSEEVPFYRALQQTVSFLTEHQPICREDLLTYLPHAELSATQTDSQPVGATVSGAEKQTDDMAGRAVQEKAEAELAKAAAHLIPGQDVLNQTVSDEPSAIIDTAVADAPPEMEEKGEPPAPAQARVSLKQRRNQSRNWRYYRR